MNSVFDRNYYFFFTSSVILRISLHLIKISINVVFRGIATQQKIRVFPEGEQEIANFYRDVRSLQIMPLTIRAGNTVITEIL